MSPVSQEGHSCVSGRTLSKSRQAKSEAVVNGPRYARTMPMTLVEPSDGVCVISVADDVVASKHASGFVPCHLHRDPFGDPGPFAPVMITAAAERGFEPRYVEDRAGFFQGSRRQCTQSSATS